MEIPEHPNIWTDGSREDFSSIGGFEVAGAGVYLPASELAFDGLVWGTAEEYGDARLERCRAFLPVTGALQTVQRAEFWGAIIALQAYWPCHLGIDNLNVARSIGCLLNSECLSKPLPLVKDGDLVALARYMIRTRGRETVRVTKVKGHAEDVDVLGFGCWISKGMVRLIMLLIWVSTQIPDRAVPHTFVQPIDCLMSNPYPGDTNWIPGTSGWREGVTAPSLTHLVPVAWLPPGK